MRPRAIVVVACLGVASLVTGCDSATSSLTEDQKAWCRANSSVTVLTKAIELGYTPQEMKNLFNDITVTGWGPVERDQRYVRACKAAYKEGR